MANSTEKLAQALESLRAIQTKGLTAIRTNDLSRTHRELLLRNGFIERVMKGWYISSHPHDLPGDTTPWFSAFWGFCADYANARHGNEWCLSSEQSVQIHAENRTVPMQLAIRCPKGGNKPIKLSHGTSIFELRGELPNVNAIVEIDRLRVYKLPNALIELTTAFYSRNPIDARAALSAITSASSLLPDLLDGGRVIIAGRLCGALRNIGRNELADEIKATMKSAGYDVTEKDPFQERIFWSQKAESPRAARLRAMWQTMRQQIVGKFPKPLKSINREKYLQQVEDAYVRDAYHSLSIEGYQVSPELIEKVRSGEWKPETDKEDQEHRNALAARGYFLAFEAVKESLKRVLKGDDAGEVADQGHLEWYRKLFSPLVDAGIQSAGSLAGYRNSRVLIRGSRHNPVSGEAVPELMSVFFELLKEERDPAVGVVLGHFAFVFIHPFSDGNGRTARFLMNLMLAAGGYPWTTIEVEQRDEYMDALEQASVHGNITFFTEFLEQAVQSQLNTLGTKIDAP